MADDWQSAWVQVLPDFSDFRNKANPQITGALGSAGNSGAAAFKASFFGQVFGGNFLANLASNAVANIVSAVSQGIQAGVQFTIDGIQLASDLGETISAINVIFGDSGDAIVDWSKTAVQRIGQTQAQALGGIKTFGALGNAAGLTGGDLESFSTSLVDLAADMASFNNTDVDTALTALRSGLSGESEPLRQFQVFLNDATLKAKALELGIYDGSGALTDQQRILAAYNVILEKTTLQQGDFERTMGGAAQQQKILNAALEQAQTTLGTYLLPGFTAAVTYINTDVLPKFGELIDRVGPQLADAFTEASPEIKALGDDILLFLEDIADDLADGGIEDLTTLLGDLVLLGSQLKDAWDWANDPDAQPAKFLNDINDALSSLADAVNGEEGLINDLFNGWVEDAQTGSDVLSQTTGDGFTGGLRKHYGPADKAGAGLVDAALGGARPKTAEWYPLGSQFGDGLAGGISSKTGKVGLAAASMANAAVSAIKKSLKIASPSKVMAELGGFAAEGFSLGWEDSRPIMTPGVSIPSIPSGTGSAGMSGAGAGVYIANLVAADASDTIRKIEASQRRANAAAGIRGLTA